MQDADLALLQRCIQGERRAWVEFVERFSRYVYFLIQRTDAKYGAGLTEADVADAHNDVFIAFLEDDKRRLRAFEGRNGCSVRSWVRLIAIRKTLDLLRRRKVHLSLDADDDDQPRRELTDTRADPLEALLQARQNERRAQLGHLIDQLSDADRLLLDLLYGQKLSVDAAAAVLRIKRGALYTRKTRVIQRLRRLAEDAGLTAQADA